MRASELRRRSANRRHRVATVLRGRLVRRCAVDTVLESLVRTSASRSLILRRPHVDT